MARQTFQIGALHETFEQKRNRYFPVARWQSLNDAAERSFQPDGQLTEPLGDTSADVEGQTRQVLAEIDRLLGVAGTRKDRILSATIYLADVSTFAENAALTPMK